MMRYLPMFALLFGLGWLAGCAAAQRPAPAAGPDPAACRRDCEQTRDRCLERARDDMERLRLELTGSFQRLANQGGWEAVEQRGHERRRVCRTDFEACTDSCGR